MKIDYALISCDDSHYLDFWPLVKKQWELLGIEPILIHIGKPRYIQGHVVHLSPKNYNLPIATCFARYWYACKLEDKVGIISDIDMIPLNYWYFNGQIKDIPNDMYIHINPCIETYTRLPSCYHIASGYTYQDALKIDSSFDKAYFNLIDRTYNNKECYIEASNMYWCYDEFYATEMLLQYPIGKLKLLERKGGQSGHRLDRTHWEYNPNKVYYDIHSLRPYKEHEKQILAIVENENHKIRSNN
jgi:hypothetical protein